MFSLAKFGGGALLAIFCAVQFAPPTALDREKLMESTQDCGSLSAPGHYPDFAPLPKYTIERQERGGATPYPLLLRISVSPKDYDRGGLVRLACELPGKFPNQPDIEALIFDDGKAARNLAPGFTDQPHNGVYLWHLRAHYVLDNEEGKEFIEYSLPEYNDGLLNLIRIKVWLKRSRPPQKE